MNIKNSLFIGKEWLDIEGRKIKHPSLIEYYSSINKHKIAEEKTNFIGLDVETISTTAELKLLGIYDHSYQYFKKNFISAIFTLLKTCSEKKKSIAYWTKLDPFILYKQFLLAVDRKEAYFSMEKYQQIDGIWNRKEKKWDKEPVISIRYLNYEMGIVKALRSNIQFYYFDIDKRFINKVWAYDINPFYPDDLETTAKKYFPYYSKLDKKFHIVDWDLFDTDPEYQKGVLLSNRLDAKVVQDLADKLSKDFANVFGYYNKSFISSGSMARASIQALRERKYKSLPEKERKENVLKDLQKIPYISYFDSWSKNLSNENFMDFLSLVNETYKGAKIDAYAFGYAKEGYIADITSAYPSEQMKLYDLTNSYIYKGEGTPRAIKNAYVFIRGLIHIPKNGLAEYHSILVKHTTNHELNICPVGSFYASYYYEERKALEDQGAIFEDETWYVLQTEGKLSILAESTEELLKMRFDLYEKGDNLESTPKRSANSVYGFTFEATNIYDIINGKVVNIGFRGGENYNPIYASRITMSARLTIFDACVQIVKNGGKPVLVMTDSIIWLGKDSDLPERLWKAEKNFKSVGYFEKPEKILDIVSLGAGRYEYYKEKNGVKSKYVAKKRGLNVENLIGEDGIVIKEFNWLKALKTIKLQHKITVNVKTLVSVGMVKSSKKLKIEDLGLVVSQKRKMELITGVQKRHLNMKNEDYLRLKDEMLFTAPVELGYGMFGTPEYSDHTLPILRRELMNMKYETISARKKESNKRRSNDYRSKNGETINMKRTEKYRFMTERGIDPENARKYMTKSWENIQEFMLQNLQKNIDNFF